MLLRIDDHFTYEEEDTCHRYEYEEGDTCNRYEDQDTCHSAFENRCPFQEEDTCHMRGGGYM